MTTRTMLEGIAKPMPLDPPVRLKIARVDADQPALHVDQRAAGIARIDRGVGLDEEPEVGNAAVRPRQRRDDAAGHRLADAEGIADGEHQVADLDGVRLGDSIAERLRHSI